jgi:hypothetical protein
MTRNGHLAGCIAAITLAALCSCAKERRGRLAEALELSQTPPPPLTRELLDQSIALATQYLLNSQKTVGNFVYEYDFLRRQEGYSDNEVRQAGALWGLALAHLYSPSDATAAAVVRGLAFFKGRSRLTPDGRRFIVYPGSREGRTGTLSLVALALVEFLRADYPTPTREAYERDLVEYIRFALSLRREDGRFHSAYSFDSAAGYGEPSGYYDGETLLMLVKAARYAGHGELKDIAVGSAESMYEHYMVRGRKEDPQAMLPKSFYQWGSMAFYELYTAGWPGMEKFAGRTIEMARWMIDERDVLSRRGNTGYAYEGLSVAWELARLTNRKEDMDCIEGAIRKGLPQLITWQVGGPAQNAFLRRHPTRDKLAVGGCMNGEADPVLRMDTTQHQAHAMMLVRRFLYRDRTGTQ